MIARATSLLTVITTCTLVAHFTLTQFTAINKAEMENKTNYLSQNTKNITFPFFPQTRRQIRALKTRRKCFINKNTETHKTRLVHQTLMPPNGQTHNIYSIKIKVRLIIFGTKYALKYNWLNWEFFYVLLTIFDCPCIWIYTAKRGGRGTDHQFKVCKMHNVFTCKYLPLTPCIEWIQVYKI